MAQESKKSAEARLDPPHNSVPAPAKAEAPVVAGTIGSDDHGPAQPIAPSLPESHAADLAEQLQRQMEAIDRRQADLDCREADLQAKIDAAKLWFDEQNQMLEQTDSPQASPEPSEETVRRQREVEERQAALDQREKDLDARQADLYAEIESLSVERGKHADRMAELDRRQQRVDTATEELLKRESEINKQRDALKRQHSDLAVAQTELQQQRQELDNLSSELEQREAQVAARHAEIQLAVKRYEGLQITERRLNDAQRTSNESSARTRHLDEAEALLAQEKLELSDARRRLQADRQALQQEQHLERKKLEAQRTQAKQDLAHEQSVIRQQNERLNEREAALERLQLELQTSQREVLEMRLATEETWAQLTGALAPASLTRSIAQVRTKLADQYEQSIRVLEELRAELETTAEELFHEQEKLEVYAKELHEWAKRRDGEIEQQAARLIARERELDRQQRLYEDLEARWSDERSELRSRIRDLLADMRHESYARAA